jgi:hypothetical protein
MSHAKRAQFVDHKTESSRISKSFVCEPHCFAANTLQLSTHTPLPLTLAAARVCPLHIARADESLEKTATIGTYKIKILQIDAVSMFDVRTPYWGRIAQW